MMLMLLQSVYRRENVVDLEPRGAAKTTHGNTGFLAWLIAEVPDIRVGLISNTSLQSRAFSRAIRWTLESNDRFKGIYGDITSNAKWTDQEWLRKDSKWHGSKDVTLFAQGVGGAIISKRFDIIVCHEKGTPILHDGEWIPVEEHPTARIQRRDGLQVKLWGLPDSEVVTPEHRYWTSFGWKEARSLGRDDVIGYPIDARVEPPQPITRNVNHVTSSGKGGVVNDWSREAYLPSEFEDTDWWWLLGLWWGDGHRGRRAFGFTVSDETISSRVVGILERHGHDWSRVEKDGCWQVVSQDTTWAEWLTTWRSGVSMKQPPAWVESIDPVLQAQLIRGYLDADGFVDDGQREIRLTSIHLPGLLAVRRMLARLGVPASIRKGVDGGQKEILGRSVNTQQKYDLRLHARYGPALGYPEAGITKWSESKNRLFIEDGFLWSKVRGIEEVKDREFVPIQTDDHTYLTAFGRSHNCDDILDDENTSTAEAREKVDTWFSQTLLPCLAPDGVVIMIGTRWGEDDLYERLTKPTSKGGKGWRGHVRAAISEDADGERVSYWPEYWTLERLDEVRSDIGTAMFMCAYMNDIRGLMEGNIFKSSDWAGDDFYFSELPPGKYVVKMGVDLASSEKERADFTARGTVAVDANGDFWVLSVYRDKRESGHAEFIYDGWAAYQKLDLVIIENQQFQSTLVQSVMEDYPWIPVEGKRSDVDKVTRARAMAAKYEAHKMHHHESLRGSDYELELLGFPKGHDDMIDAVGFAMELGSGGGLVFSAVRR